MLVFLPSKLVGWAVSWEDQGRQHHMWFGHDTAPVKPKDTSDDGIFGSNGLAQRILSAAVPTRV